MSYFRRLYQDSPVPMYIYDNDSYGFLEVNDAALRQYGYSREKFLSLTAFDLRPKEEIPTFLDANRHVPLSFNDFGIWKHIDRSGKVFYVHIYAHLTIFEGRKAKSVLAANIDDKVRADAEISQKTAEIKEILENLRAIINTTSDKIWSMDTQRRIITANESFWTWLDACPKSIPEKPCSEFLPPDWNDYFDMAFGGKTFSVIWQDTNSPKPLFAELSFNPIRNEKQEITGISCFSRDITERQLYLTMIERQNAKLREISWFQSHQVRGPLSNIMGLVDTFNHDDAADPNNAKIIEYLKQEALKFDGVIRRISEEAQPNR